MTAESVPFIEQNLMPGEKLLATGRIHLATLYAPAAFLALPTAFVLFAFFIPYPIVILLAVLAALFTVGIGLILLGLIIEQATTEYGLTDKRIVIKRGWLSTRVREMPLGQIQAIRVDQGILGKVFGYGSIVTVGTGGSKRACVNIADPFEFYRLAREHMSVYENI